ncbi:universal stress protein [Nitrobacter sp. TKz-YC02]|jgi:nucleotide-binding universal stress UspA family protein|uniref:universal stress protein n=1 Tax=Nitrobacter sp. TKz-YC02 TaxID=3398704 RepID=UPI003CEB657D
MFKSILVPIDLTNTDLAKPAVATAVLLSQTSNGTIRLLNVLHMTPVMLTEYVPADFDMLQRQSSQEALAIVAREVDIEPSRISSVVRQGSSVYHEILEESQAVDADLIVMASHRPAMKTYFLGSNAGYVVRYASCSVLVVRH